MKQKFEEFLNKFIGIIEKGGNALPHPASLFVRFFHRMDLSDDCVDTSRTPSRTGGRIVLSFVKSSFS